MRYSEEQIITHWIENVADWDEWKQSAELFPLFQEWFTDTMKKECPTTLNKFGRMLRQTVFHRAVDGFNVYHKGFELEDK